MWTTNRALRLGKLAGSGTTTPCALAGEAGTANLDDGTIAEVTLWAEVALTASEISALAQGVSPNLIRPIGRLFQWPMWGVASPEPDISGSSNNGTVTGTSLADHAPVGRPFPFKHRFHFGTRLDQLDLDWIDAYGATPA